MKKILKFLSIFIFTLIFSVGCQKSDIEPEKVEKIESTPLFYKISKNNSDTNIYLLGSIHAADDTAYPLNDKIMKSFNDSEYLAVEVDIVSLENDLEQSLKLANKLMYNDGTTIKDYLSEDLYNDMVEFLKEKKLYNHLYDNYKPAFFESLFENAMINDASLNAQKGIDIYFLNLAKENNKNILEIETAEMQYNLLLNSTPKLDEINIASLVYDYTANVEELKKTYAAWKKGDETLLEELLNEEDTEGLTDEEIKLLEQYNESLITDRNYEMAFTLDKYFKEDKNVFCVVGLGHVIGDKGIVKLMLKKGYKVDLIK